MDYDLNALYLWYEINQKIKRSFKDLGHRLPVSSRKSSVLPVLACPACAGNWSDLVIFQVFLPSGPVCVSSMSFAHWSLRPSEALIGAA